MAGRTRKTLRQIEAPDSGVSDLRNKQSKSASKSDPSAHNPAPKAGDSEHGAGGGHMKVVRDSFTMPARDYKQIDALKKRSIELGVALKKSEILRAGLAALNAMPIDRFAELVSAVDSVKTGRPSRQKKKANRRKHAKV